MHNVIRSRFARLIISSLVSLFLILSLSSVPGIGQEQPKLVLPQSTPQAQPGSPLDYQMDTLLVMPSKTANGDEISEAIKEVHGTIVEKIGEGPMTTYVVRTERGKFLQTEAKLLKDKHFAAIQRNYICKVKANPVNDPYYPSEWYLSFVNATNAWSYSRGQNSTIGILDTGCQLMTNELAGKSVAIGGGVGYDAINARPGQYVDVQGHGTMVATTAAALANNGINTAGVANLSRIYPVRVGNSDGSVSESAILRGIYQCGNSGIRIINISANATPPYSFANQSAHSVLHTYLRWFHDSKNGLVFNAAGNEARQDTNPYSPYLIVVSAVSKQASGNASLASFSNYGSCIWFTAPGQDIYCSDRNGRVVSVAGTSFSAPIVAAVAALIWSRNPALTNRQVESILQNTATKAGTGWNKYYGWGMPNAYAALQQVR